MPSTISTSGTQVATTDQEPSLSELAKTIRSGVVAIEAAADIVDKAVSGALPHVLKVGRAAIEAKRQVPKRQWGEWVRQHSNTSKRHIDRYIKITVAYDDLGHSVSQNLGSLSFRGLMRLLTPSKKRDNAARGTRRRPEQTKAGLDPLAFADASPTERAHFISSIGWPKIAEAIPANWHPTIETWLHPKPPSPVLDRDGNVIPDDLSIPDCLKIIPPAPRRLKKPANAKVAA